MIVRRSQRDYHLQFLRYLKANDAVDELPHHVRTLAGFDSHNAAQIKRFWRLAAIADRILTDQPKGWQKACLGCEHAMKSLATHGDGESKRRAKQKAIREKRIAIGIAEANRFGRLYRRWG